MTSAVGPRGHQDVLTADVFSWSELPDLLAAEALFDGTGDLPYGPSDSSIGIVRRTRERFSRHFCTRSGENVQLSGENLFRRGPGRPKEGWQAESLFPAEVVCKGQKKPISPPVGGYQPAVAVSGGGGSAAAIDGRSSRRARPNACRNRRVVT